MHVTHRGCSAALAVAALLLAAPPARPASPPEHAQETDMNYEQRQQKVQQMLASLQKTWDGSVEPLRQFASEKNPELRRDIYAMYWRLGTAEANAAKRAAAVELMVEKTTEETPLLRGQLLKWLQDFRKEDFNASAKQRLLALPWTPDYAPEVIRVIGIAQPPESAARLKREISAHPLKEPPPVGYEAKNPWAVLLALARYGDDAALASVLERVQREPSSVTRASVLLYDLGYTLRPAAFDLLKKYVNSNQRLPQIKDNVPGRLEASHAAAVFSKYVRGFPIQETDFSEQQTLQARAWVNAQSSWSFN